MAEKLPALKPKELVRVLRRAGFYVHHQTGSRPRLLHGSSTELRVTVRIHSKGSPPSPLKRILKQASLSEEEFRKALCIFSAPRSLVHSRRQARTFSDLRWAMAPGATMNIGNLPGDHPRNAGSKETDGGGTRPLPYLKNRVPGAGEVPWNAPGTHAKAPGSDFLVLAYSSSLYRPRRPSTGLRGPNPTDGILASPGRNQPLVG